MKTKFHHKEPGMILTYYLVISVNNCLAFNMVTKLKQNRLRFMINNSTASSNDVDDGQAD